MGKLGSSGRHNRAGKNIPKRRQEHGITKDQWRSELTELAILYVKILVLNGHRFLDIQNYTISQVIFCGNAIFESLPDENKKDGKSNKRQGPVKRKQSYYGDR